jgi:hypothetical protein
MNPRSALSERLSLTINVRSENIACGDRHAVELLATCLVGQCKKAEPFGGKVEGTEANVYRERQALTQ